MGGMTEVPTQLISQDIVFLDVPYACKCSRLSKELWGNLPGSSIYWKKMVCAL